MHIFDIITISLRNLWKQKFRTFLTTAAVIIGALLISIVFSMINGLENFFALQFETFSDPKVIEVHSQKFDFGEMFSSFGLGGGEPSEVKEGDTNLFTPKPFKDEQIEKLRGIGGVEQLVEWTNPSAKSMRLEDVEKKYQISIMAVPKFMQEKVDLVAGKYIEDDDLEKVIIANQYLAVWDIDDADEVIGKKVIIEVEQEGGTICPPGCQSLDPNLAEPEVKEYEFEISGVMEKTIMTTLVVISPKESIEIEKFRRSTEEVLTDNDSSRFVAMLLVESEEKVPEVESAIEDLGHNAQTYNEQKNQIGKVLDILKYFLSAFGVIAMAVASLGIINTLFMAIYERTREIGVMKAVGARNINILILFIFEAALIGLIGGFVGMFCGLGVAHVVNWILHGGLDAIDFLSGLSILSSYETLNIAAFSMDLLIAPILSTIVSTVAGLLPAWRASKLSPVDALRYE